MKSRCVCIAFFSHLIPRSSNCAVLDWYFALAQETPLFQQYCDLARVAAYSALKNTSLKPHCVYDGAENRFTEWLKDHDIPILRHRGFLHDLLDSGVVSDVVARAVISGALLRVDLPEIVPRTSGVVLYTDCDVMFRADVADELVRTDCPLFAVGPESDPQNYEDMNTGVMLMNLGRLRETLPGLRDFIRKNFDLLRQEAWDQGAYRRYYRDSSTGEALWTRLPPELNWKPYWSDYSRAKIIHFHGPKPYQKPYIDSHWPELKFLTGGCYDELCDIWNTLDRESL
jgi:hypothetical protein